MGITYRVQNASKSDEDTVEILSTENRPFNNELDKLPYPARDLIDNNLYTRPDTGEIQGVIKVSRGCPFHCFFCLATPVSGAKVRYRSPENILGEIKECLSLIHI